MMKKTGLLITVLAANLFAAQCTIEGKNTIGINTEETYTVKNATLHCSNCIIWETLGTNANIVSSNKNTAKIRATSQGQQVIMATALTISGAEKCLKKIDIVANNEVNTNNLKNNQNCDIEADNYMETKSSETTVTFFPNEINTNFKYQWKVTYFDGETLMSNQYTPVFPYNKTKGIKYVNLKINSNKYMKELTKSYEENYWKVFK